jgi:hypothetical protein
MVAAPADDSQVPAFWRALGLPGLVDAHVHFLPESMERKVWAWFDAIVDDRGAPAWPIRYREAAGARVDLLHSLGVVAFPGLVYPHKPGMAEWLNGWARDFAAATPGCIPSATFYPEPDADRYVAEALEAGARIFKVHLEVGGYDPRDRTLAPVWRRLAAAAVPVVAHCGSGPFPGPYTGPATFGDVLAAHPDLVAVIAHMGTTEYAEFLALALRHPNVHLDTTMAFTDFMEARAPYPPDLLPVLADHPGRVLFGSDFPTIPHPYAHQLAALVGLGLGDDWLRAVCWHNGARLLGVPGATPTDRPEAHPKPG